MREALPKIHRLTLTKLVDEQVNEMIDILQTFASYCIIDEEMKEPNTVNQNILYTNGSILFFLINLLSNVTFSINLSLFCQGFFLTCLIY